MQLEENQLLSKVAKEIKDRPYWQEYQLYCLERKKGLRKKAFFHLGKFVSQAQEWENSQTQDFVSYILTICECNPLANTSLLPHPLSNNIIKPFMVDWCGLKEDSRPFRWLARFYNKSHLLSDALQLNPEDNLARKYLLNHWLDHLYFSTHHLPAGYLGEIQADLSLKMIVSKELIAFQPKEQAAVLEREFKIYFDLIDSYRDWKNSNFDNFEKWAKTNARPFRLEHPKAYYFQKE